MIRRTINNQGFTLFELAISLTIFAMLMISVLLSVENMAIARIKTDNRVTLLQELYFFSEQLVTNVKDGGSLDYEEYWNRQSYDTRVGSGTYSGTGMGHYLYPTGVGNYGSGASSLNGSGPFDNHGDGLYYCRSNNGGYMGTGGCLTGYNAASSVSSTGGSYVSKYQRYGQYTLQFMDYNGNADSDLGNEDSDASGSIINDEDDKDLGDAPEVISGSLTELYLINLDEETRTYFRWNVVQDPGTSTGCFLSDTGVPNDGCRGNVQVLKLRGLDIGYSHSGIVTDTGAFDGVVDSWICHADWRCAGANMIYGTGATGRDSEWVDLFPDTINVKSIGFTAYPKKDPWKSWAALDMFGSTETSPFIHPYVRIELTLGFSWGKRRTIKNDDPTISINTSVSLGGSE